MHVPSVRFTRRIFRVHAMMCFSLLKLPRRALRALLAFLASRSCPVGTPRLLGFLSPNPFSGVALSVSSAGAGVGLGGPDLHFLVAGLLDIGIDDGVRGTGLGAFRVAAALVALDDFAG